MRIVGEPASARSDYLQTEFDNNLYKVHFFNRSGGRLVFERNATTRIGQTKFGIPPPKFTSKYFHLTISLRLFVGVCQFFFFTKRPFVPTFLLARLFLCVCIIRVFPSHVVVSQDILANIKGMSSGIRHPGLCVRTIQPVHLFLANIWMNFAFYWKWRKGTFLYDPVVPLTQSTKLNTWNSPEEAIC